MLVVNGAMIFTDRQNCSQWMIEKSGARIQEKNGDARHLLIAGTAPKANPSSGF